MTNAFRIRTKDGFVSPVTRMTNVHGIDKDNVIVPGPVGLAIIAGKINWKDAVVCVVSGKDPSVLLKNPDAAKPRAELQSAPDFDQAVAAAPEEPEEVKVSELLLARSENRAPDLSKLTDEELSEQATLVGVDPKAYSSLKALTRAVQKKMDAAGT